ncbi:MAG: AMP-binding protein [Eubacterium sp.]|nr:AMP-binding protein [Eubacterium sp.]
MYFFDDFNKYGARTALQQDDGSAMTYEQLQAHADWIGGIVPARSLVFCLCENVIGSAAGYLGFLQKRIVPLLLDAGINTQLLSDLIELYRPAWIYLPGELAASYITDADGTGSRTLPGNLQGSEEQWGYVLAKTDFDQSAEPQLYQDLALLLTTSGSTGSPKLVRQSYENIQSNADSIVEYLEIDETERPITTLPMHYTYGLSVLNSHILKGAAVLMTRESVIGKPFWDFFKKEQATSIAGVPYTYEMLKRIRFFRMDLPSLRTMTQAGGKILPELHREFAEYAAEKGKRFVVMYGQTEATARMGYLPADKALEKVGSMGIVIPGGTFDLIDVDGSEITETHKTGELVYRGPNVTLGYAEKREDLAHGDERGGILETGDMAQIDEDGYYYIVGRKKRFLKLFGSRVNLDEVERMIRNEFPDADCACSGNDDQLRVYVTDPRALGEVQRFLITRTHINQKAIRVQAISEIPRNDSGKIIYQALN